MNNLSPAWPNKAAWGTATSLRAWQAAAMEKYFAEAPRDFLAVATPGAAALTGRSHRDVIHDFSLSGPAPGSTALFVDFTKGHRLTASPRTRVRS